MGPLRGYHESGVAVRDSGGDKGAIVVSHQSSILVPLTED